MIILIALLLLFYIFILIKLIRGLKKLRSGNNQTQHKVSVVVAARYEEQNIEQCIRALIAQTYPKEKLEIIFVDDRSTDNTAAIVRQFSASNSNLILTHVDETAIGMAPKKHALNKGIQQATGDIIAITDADTIPSPGWIESLITYFEPRVGVVAGFSPLDRSSNMNLLSKLIRLDSLALAAIAAGSFGNGFPLTCNARNLAYRKAVYQEIGGFQDIAHLISGDDDLFVHLVRRKTAWQFSYAIDPQAIVSSRAPASWREFVNQRVRHASKGKYYPLGLKIGLAAVYLLNVLLLIMVPLSFIDNRYFTIFGVSLLLKSLSEFILLHRTAVMFEKKGYLSCFPLAAMLHIPYVVFFGLLGQISAFRWKGERFNAKL